MTHVTTHTLQLCKRPQVSNHQALEVHSYHNPRFAQWVLHNTLRTPPPTLVASLPVQPPTLVTCRQNQSPTLVTRLQDQPPMQRKTGAPGRLRKRIQTLLLHNSLSRHEVFPKGPNQQTNLHHQCRRLSHQPNQQANLHHQSRVLSCLLFRTYNHSLKSMLLHGGSTSKYFQSTQMRSSSTLAD